MLGSIFWYLNFEVWLYFVSAIFHKFRVIEDNIYLIWTFRSILFMKPYIF